jgi:DNA-binding NtrC family response regulator
VEVKALGSTARILVIDDDQSIRETFAAILQDKGYSVDLAENGYEAIQKSEQTTYNVALIDVRLPDMEGTVLLPKLKERMPKTRKIMVTGFPSLNNAITSLNQKADAYIVKPVDIDQLLATIKEQLKLQSEEKIFDEQKVAAYIETRIKELEETQKK